MPLLFGARPSWPHGGADFFSFFFYPCRPITILCSRKGSSKSRMKPWPARTDRTRPGESRVGGPRPAGNHQCSAAAPPQHRRLHSSHQLWPRGRVVYWRVHCNGRSEEQRIGSERELALQEDQRLRLQWAPTVSSKPAGFSVFFRLLAVSASPAFPCLTLSLYNCAGRPLPPSSPLLSSPQRAARVSRRRQVQHCCCLTAEFAPQLHPTVTRGPSKSKNTNAERRGIIHPSIHGEP